MVNISAVLTAVVSSFHHQGTRTESGRDQEVLTLRREKPDMLRYVGVRLMYDLWIFGPIIFGVTGPVPFVPLVCFEKL